MKWSDDIPVPKPGAGQVLVRVLAAGVNNTDINTRVGWYAREVTDATEAATGEDVEAGGWGGSLNFPLIQGGDICGTVVALGEGVDSSLSGRRVTCPINLPRSTLADPIGIQGKSIGCFHTVIPLIPFGDSGKGLATRLGYLMGLLQCGYRLNST